MSCSRCTGITPCFTDSTEPMLIAEAHHRDHAIVEQVIADLKGSALKHFPSGSFNANGAWLACAVIAYNLARAAGVLAGGKLRKGPPPQARRSSTPDTPMTDRAIPATPNPTPPVQDQLPDFKIN